MLLPLLSACATRPTDPDDLAAYNEAHDPAEPTNRAIYRVNLQLDKYVLKPAALGYRAITNTPVRDAIHNFLLNLDSPVLFANDVLEGKPTRAAATFTRFVLNSTVGIGGFLDIGTDLGVRRHYADFGETLAVWGVPQGPFVELPLYGPSDPRDAIGKGVDIAMDPFTWIGKGDYVTAAKISRFALEAVDRRERAIDALDAINKTSLDPYATIRSLYRQNEAADIATIESGDKP